MIDLHTHILPGIDDGSRNMEESLEMCRIAAAGGTRGIVATSHGNLLQQRSIKMLTVSLNRSWSGQTFP